MIAIEIGVARSVMLCLCLNFGAASGVFAQSDAVAPVAKAAEANGQTAIANPAEVGPTWSALNFEQKTALAPLAASWPTLSAAHKNKWIALVEKYQSMADSEKARLQSRMVDWAALSPKDRELARLNFAQTKKLSTDSRVANWEAYQALPENQRQALLEAAPKKPVGAAIAVKPVQASKLAEVPVTRKTPEPVRIEANQRAMVDRYTLLPQNPGTKESVQAPAPPAK